VTSDALAAALIPVLTALATGLPLMFGALRQVPRVLELLTRGVGAAERIADRLDSAHYVEFDQQTHRARR
jgi:hypothetical protein